MPSPRYVHLLLGATAFAYGCFSPAFEDGAIACGEAGCPPGFLCAADGFCRIDPDDPTPPGGGDDPGEVTRSLAVAVGHDNGVRVYAYCGGTLEQVWSGPGEVRQVSWGDMNNNGRADLAVANAHGPVVIYEYTPDGFMSRWVSDEQRGSRAVALADFDGDSIDDLVVGLDEGPLQLYTSFGNAGGLARTWATEAAARNWEVATGDFDGDGDPDLAVAVKLAPDQVYINDGGALRHAWSSPTSDESESVSWADLDGDRLLDLAIGSENAPARVYRFDGASFVEAWLSPSTEDFEAVAWVDYDNDGDADLSAAGRETRVYRNDGGALTAVWSYDSGDNNNGNGGGGNNWDHEAETIAWADFDGDGDQDCYLGRLGADDVLLRNDGGDDFTEIWRSEGQGESTRSAEWRWIKVPPGAPPLCPP